MPIHVTCPGCLARFTVSEKFAGKQGACPKCKGVIKVPELDAQVVIHAPEHSEAGAKDATGQYVLKPIERTKTKVQPVLIVVFVGLALLAPLTAWLLRGSPSPFLLAAGAILIAPPLCWGGYAFLRNPELEGYEGMSLWIRTAICSVLYAALWGVHAVVYPLIFGEQLPQTWQWLFVAPPYALAGASIAYLCYDLDFGNGFFHYALYLLITIVLRVIMGLHPIYQPPPATEAGLAPLRDAGATVACDGDLPGVQRLEPIYGKLLARVLVRTPTPGSDIL